MRLRVGNMDKNPIVRLVSNESPTTPHNRPIHYVAGRHQTPIRITAGSDTSDIEMRGESRTYTRKTTTTTVTERTEDDGDDGGQPPRRGGGQPPRGGDTIVLHRYPVAPIPPINININIGAYPEIAPEAPRFRQNLTDSVVTEGGSITITCTISGHPFPRITWYKADTLIRESQDFQYLINGNRVSLKIKVALPQDTGEYTCRADNTYGSTSCTCRVTVYRKCKCYLKVLIEKSRLLLTVSNRYVSLMEMV